MTQYCRGPGRPANRPSVRPKNYIKNNQSVEKKKILKLQDQLPQQLSLKPQQQNSQLTNLLTPQYPYYHITSVNNVTEASPTSIYTKSVCQPSIDNETGIQRLPHVNFYNFVNI